MTTENEKRIDVKTNRPEIFKNGAWVVDWDALANPVNALTPHTLTITTPSGDTTHTIYEDLLLGSFRLVPTAGKQFVESSDIADGTGLASVHVTPEGLVNAVSDGTATATLTIQEEDITSGKVGELWQSLVASNKPVHVILDGQSFDNVIYPLLAALAATMDIITDNGDGTSTVDFSGYFPRPETDDTKIGDRVADSFRSHRHAEGSSTYAAAGGGNGSTTGSNDFTSNLDGRTTRKYFTYNAGSSETAPKHIGFYYGIWGA